MTDKNERAKEIEESVRRADAEREAKEKADAEHKSRMDANVDKMLAGLDSVLKTCDALGKRMDAMEGAAKKPASEGREAEQTALMGDDDPLARQNGDLENEAALVDAQARCDSVAAAFGQRAPVPMTGELARNYRRRAARYFQQHSADFKGTDLVKLDAATFEGVEKRIYADAMTAAKVAPKFEDDVERSRVTTSPSGHRITTFYRNHSFVRDFTVTRGHLIGMPALRQGREA